MNNSNQNGISAITAATMIATGAIGDLETHGANHIPTKPQPGRRISLWSRSGRRVSHVNGAIGMLKPSLSHNNNKTRSISYAYGETMKAPFVNVSSRQSYQEPDSLEMDSQSKTESLSNIVISASSSYAILLICIFTAFSFSGLVTFPLMYRWLDTHGFFVYLYLISIIYLLYLTFHVVRKENESADRKALKVVENIEVKSEF